MTFPEYNAKFQTLDELEKKFVIAVYYRSGVKYPYDGCMPEGHIALWIKPEELGLIECAGSFKWLSTCPCPLEV